MAERLGLGIIPGAGWRAAEVRAVAREAEEAGFDAIFTAEVDSDALATAQLMLRRPGGSKSALGSPASICATPTPAPRQQA
jgi:hypothetical protein